ncbi:MAG: TatD family hydrolase [Deltaproteobacteria bacterium]|nr:TatD family hydrolase [Deltaproteobacteria bacterium]
MPSSGPALIDIGVNLTHRSFADDHDRVVDRAVAAGVTALILTGTSEATSRSAQVLAAARPGVLFSTAGVHPHDARHCDDATIESLRSIARLPAVVAIGECGLDFNRDFSPREVQERVFEQQLGLAAELGLPVFLHERDAHARFVAILRAHRASLVDAVVHCFTGTAAELDVYLEVGACIGITGWICDERRGRDLRKLTSRIPLDRLMIETDAPFLAPRDLRPRVSRNEPAYLPHILAAIAGERAESIEVIAAATTATARRVFRLPT